MIEQIYIDGFRHFKHFSLPLRKTTLICGLNGTGKSTVIDVMDRLRNFLIRRDPVELVCGTKDTPHWGKSGGANVLSSSLGFDWLASRGELFKYRLEVVHDPVKNQSYVLAEQLLVDEKIIYLQDAQTVTVFMEDSGEMPLPADGKFSGLHLASRLHKGIEKFLNEVEQKIYPLAIKPHTVSSFHTSPEPVLKMDASNFSAWYDAMLQENPAETVEVFKKYKYFIPGFKKLALKNQGWSKELIADIYHSENDTYQLSLKDLSDGQKILCILHLLFRIAPAHSCILIDEFENFLSPAELQPLYNLAQDAHEERDIQFIFISHHHKTLNWFHDTATLLYNQGLPPYVRAKTYDPAELVSLAQRLENPTHESDGDTD